MQKSKKHEAQKNFAQSLRYYMETSDLAQVFPI